MHMLGRYYRESGENEKSFLWFKSSADLGHDDSRREVARAYLHGIGTAVDSRRAEEYEH